MLLPGAIAWREVEDEAIWVNLKLVHLSPASQRHMSPSQSFPRRATAPCANQHMFNFSLFHPSLSFPGSPGAQFKMIRLVESVPRLGEHWTISNFFKISLRLFQLPPLRPLLDRQVSLTPELWASDQLDQLLKFSCASALIRRSRGSNWAEVEGGWRYRHWRALLGFFSIPAPAPSPDLLFLSCSVPRFVIAFLFRPSCFFHDNASSHFQCWIQAWIQQRKKTFSLRNNHFLFFRC